MAKFRVGQKVRLIAYKAGDLREVPLRAEGVIVKRGTLTATGPCDFSVDFAAFGKRGCNACQLAPLTDPKADAFLESMRKMKPYEEPTVERGFQMAPIDSVTAEKLRRAFGPN
jgi:hypothetical protein